MTKLAEQDEMAARFYEDPANLEVTGPPQRVARPRRLSSHVPIRFSAAAIAKVKFVSDEDGLTVSSWVRRLVERELDRRLSARNETTVSVHVPQQIQADEPASVTGNHWALAQAS
jgi:hypothetical protein